MNTTLENGDFARLIVSLEPWLDEVVVIGGWAHRLYRLDARAQQLNYPPLMTLDTDVAVPSGLEIKGRDIRECLLANGFKEELLGDDKPPATLYRLGDEKTRFYAEFLTPLTGSDYRRGGNRNATLRIAGVVAQKLRYIELLLYGPWTVNLDKSKGFPLEPARQVRVASPASFLAHKILVQGRRSHAKLAKDVLYIHDTLEVFGGRLQELSDEWKKHVRPRLHTKRAKTVERAAETLFGEISDSVREAARMASGRKLSPGGIQEVCNLGLKKVFG